MRKIKVAVISDIHGNVVALKEILKDCESQNVDKYIFTGDMTTELPFGNETLNIVKNLTTYVVRGNKEEYITEYDKQKFKWDNIQFKNAIFLHKLFSKENIEYINNLPLSLSLEFEGVKLFVCHASPQFVYEQIHEEDIDKIDKYTKYLKEDILVFGHTHDKIWSKKYNGKLVINAGCAGVSPFNKNRAEYIIFDINDGKYEVIKRLVEFDIKILKDMIMNSGILEVDDVLMNLTYLPFVGKGDIRHNFFVEAKELSRKKGRRLYKDDATGIYTYFKLFDDDIWLGLAEKYRNDFELK